MHSILTSKNKFYKSYYVALILMTSALISERPSFDWVGLGPFTLSLLADSYTLLNKCIYIGEKKDQGHGETLNKPFRRLTGSGCIRRTWACLWTRVRRREVAKRCHGSGAGCHVVPAPGKD